MTYILYYFLISLSLNFIYISISLPFSLDSFPFVVYTYCIQEPVIVLKGCIMLSDQNIFFIDCLRSAVHNTPLQKCNPPSEELTTVMHCAEQHAVLPMIYDRLVPAIPSPASLLPWKQQALLTVYHQTVRTQEFLHLNRLLAEADLKIPVVKGILCRHLYPQPDQRISGDEDLLVPDSAWDQMHAVLTEAGYIAQGDHDTQVATYIHAGTGLRLEAHHHLFSDSSTAFRPLNRIFSDVFSRMQPYEIDGTTVYGMCPTDHMLYLLFHAYKHFLHAGFGIRQVCDINLYGCRYKEQIDWQYVQNILHSHYADVFSAAVFTIGSVYLAFPEAAYLSVSSPDPEPLLNDILNGGLYGASSEDRQHSSMITLHAFESEKQSTVSHILHTAFPPLDAMQGKYPYLLKVPALLPAAWIQRIGTYLFSGRKASAGESIRIGTERIALLRKYNMLP